MGVVRHVPKHEPCGYVRAEPSKWGRITIFVCPQCKRTYAQR